MTSPLAFPYTPSKGAIPFTFLGVNCALDCIENTATELKFGVLEVVGPGMAQWMGTDANSAGGPVWTIETQQSPLGPTSIPNPANDPLMPGQGTALDFINAMGTRLITDFIPALNAQLRVRFPSVPVPVPGGPPFAKESDAIAWLQGVLVTALKVTNGVVS